MYVSLKNRPILVYGVGYWITLLSSRNCKNQVMGYLGHLCRAGKVRGRVRVPLLSLSFQALETSLDKISVPLFPSRSIFRSCPCPTHVYSLCKKRRRKENSLHVYIDSDIDGFWMETAIDGRVDKEGRVPRLSIRECK